MEQAPTVDARCHSEPQARNLATTHRRYVLDSILLVISLLIALSARVRGRDARHIAWRAQRDARGRRLHFADRARLRAIAPVPGLQRSA